MNFLDNTDIKLSKQFLKKGYIIHKVKNLEALLYLQNKVIKETKLKKNRNQKATPSVRLRPAQMLQKSR